MLTVNLAYAAACDKAGKQFAGSRLFFVAWYRMVLVGSLQRFQACHVTVPVVSFEFAGMILCDASALGVQCQHQPLGINLPPSRQHRHPIMMTLTSCSCSASDATHVFNTHTMYTYTYTMYTFVHVHVHHHWWSHSSGSLTCHT
jgi:hypothetical protein